MPSIGAGKKRKKKAGIRRNPSTNPPRQSLELSTRLGEESQLPPIDRSLYQFAGDDYLKFDIPSEQGEIAMTTPDLALLQGRIGVRRTGRDSQTSKLFSPSHDPLSPIPMKTKSPQKVSANLSTRLKIHARGPNPPKKPKPKQPTPIATRFVPDMTTTNQIDSGTALLGKMRTARDAVAHFTNKNSDSVVKFVHCKAMTKPIDRDYRPYDLAVITSEESRHLKEYFTISGKGVTLIRRHSPSEFTPLSDWIRESTVFSALRARPFFSQYIERRNLMKWRKFIVRQHFDHAFANVKRGLLQIRPHFTPFYVEALNALHTLRIFEGFDFQNTNQSRTPDEWIQNQKAQFFSVTEVAENTGDKLLNLLIRLSQNIEARIDPDRKGVDESDDKGPIRSKRLQSIVAAKAEQMARRQSIADAKWEMANLYRFIRLIDTMFTQTRAQLVQNTAIKLLKTISGSSVAKESTVGRVGIRNGLIRCELQFVDGSDIPILQPSPKEVENLLFKSLDDLADAISSSIHLFQTPVLREFSPPTEKEELASHDLANFENNFDGPGPDTVQGTLLLHSHHQQVLQEIKQKIDIDQTRSEEFCEAYRPLHKIYLFAKQWNKVEYVNRDHSVDDLRFDLETFTNWTRLIERASAGQGLGAIHIDAQMLRGKLVPIAEEGKEAIQESGFKMVTTLCDNAVEALRNHTKAVAARPTQLDEFVAFHTYVDKLGREQGDLARMVTESEEIIRLFEGNSIKIPVSSRASVELARETLQIMEQALIQAEDFIITSREEQTANTNERLKENTENIESVLEELNEGLLIDPSADPQASLSKLQDIQKTIDSIREEHSRLSHYSEIFTGNEANQEKLNEVENQHKFRQSIWNTVKNWGDFEENINHSNWRDIDTEEAAEFIQENYKAAVRFSRRDTGSKVCKILRRNTEQLREKISLIQDLGNPALQNNHWEKIFELLDAPSLTPDSSFSLDHLLQAGAWDKHREISEISSVASGEYSLLLALRRVSTTMQKATFDVKPYARGGSKSIEELTKENAEYFILSSVEDITQIIEDNQVALSTMMASRFVVGIRGQVEQWAKRLALLSELLDEWVQCQVTWLYLEVIFGQPDIQRQLPNEHRTFETVDLFWKNFMKRAAADSRILRVARAQNLTAFQQRNKELDEIQKRLEEYLETKRMSFPRFFFLSNDELLQILSQTTDPHAVQPHLRKIFENINKISFDKKNKELVTEMHSVEGEVVKFEGPEVVASGPVEFWLTKVEDAMCYTVKDFFKRSLQARQKGAQRIEWLFEWPAQGIFNTECTLWTHGTEESLKNLDKDPKSLENFLQETIQSIEELVIKVRQDLSKLQRRMIGTLVVLSVHNRDVLSAMCGSGVDHCDSVQDFGWEKQLRYYWDIANDDCVIRQTSTALVPGYEYYGIPTRLVITPLTDRCYITLTSAMALHLGGSPQGPAGTGKTESVKDLAKAMAIQCVVFNCSEGLDYVTMGRFFCGLAQCGAWACFDEFNRIDIEVLSVIAQQILTIQRAVIAESETFVFEDREIKLNPKCGFFITMNPGYAGRTELPDNLKALFRPVSMMVPDYALIAEITLFSEGFSTAKDLSRKMTQLYKLSSEQLSQQDHYDFGMRALKAVLVMAGSLKRQYQNLSEDIVLIRAMRDSNVPKFLAEDVPLFMGIVQDLFPGVDIPSVDFGNLQKQVETELRKEGLQVVPSFVEKILQFYDTHIVRHGLMLVGEGSTGKTTIRRILSKALTSLYYRDDLDEKSPHFKPVIIDELNPKSISMGELYGEFNACFFKDTQVRMADFSSKKISEIKQWELVLGPDFKPRKVTSVIHGKERLIEVVLENGNRYLTTTTHKFVFDQKGVRTILKAKELLSLSRKELSMLNSIFLQNVHEEPNLSKISSVSVGDTELEWAGFECIDESNPLSQESHLFLLSDGLVAHNCSHEWKDGLVASIARNVTSDTNDNKRWIIFDGPVDALWIENMNTVLDDNKMLCLANSERIRLPPKVNLIFEVADLAEASPATVSRCGMVYIGEDHLGWEPLVRSWCESEFIDILRCLILLEDYNISYRDRVESSNMAIEKWKTARAAKLEGKLDMNKLGLSDENGTVEEDTTRPEVTQQNSDGESSADSDVPEVKRSNDIGEPSPENISALGLLLRWNDALEGALNELSELLIKMLDEVIPQIVEKTSSLPKDIPILRAQCVSAFLKYFSSLLQDRIFYTMNRGSRKQLDEVAENKLIEQVKIVGSASPNTMNIILQRLMYSLVWAFGGFLRAESRVKFNEIIHSIFQNNDDLATVLPHSGYDLFSYRLDESSRSFAPWDDVVPDFTFSKTEPAYEMLVETNDTVKLTNNISLLLRHDVHCFIVGPTGTGKSALIKKMLTSEEFEKNNIVSSSLTFSAQTTSTLTQNIIEEKLEKKRKNLYGPPSGKKQVFFVDDVNMPELEVYGAQPPIEILRQMIGQGGYYDRDKLFFKHMENTSFISACAPPGGGRNPLPTRFTRLFAVLSAPELSRDSLTRIFTCILGGFLDLPSNNDEYFIQGIQDMTSSVIEASVRVYETMREEMRPTPFKSHYTFNLRSLSAAVLGLLQATPKQIPDEASFLRLWCHEISRVFRDRLCTTKDMHWFDLSISGIMGSVFPLKDWKHIRPYDEFPQDFIDSTAHPSGRVLNLPPEVQTVVGKNGPSEIMFGRWALTPEEDRAVLNLDPDAPVSEREALVSYRDLTHAPGRYTEMLNTYYEDFSMNVGSDENSLVFFKDAIHHFSRIFRIITKPRGNALLVGPGGSGRQSLVRLATHAAQYKLFQIEITKGYRLNEFHEDLKTCLLDCGTKNQQLVFLLTDSQICDESFIESLNNLLNSGEVPNLWLPEEFDKIIRETRPLCKAAGKTEDQDTVYGHFVSLCRANFHLCLCLSPLGEAFRRRCRQFPALISCMTIDWFFPWPEEALLSVAESFFSSIDLELGGDETKQKRQLARVCVGIHTSVEKFSGRFFEELRRHNYTTPTSYLELLRQYLTLLDEKRKEISSKVNTFSIGLEKLQETAEEVATMQKNLEEMQPVLAEKVESTKTLLERLKVDQSEAAKVRVVVTKEKESVAKLAREAQAIKDDAQHDLDQALPAYYKAIKSLKSLNKGDITEMKSFKKPPPLVVTVMEAVCILKEVKPTWDEAMRLLSDIHFLESLAKYDRDNISPKILRQLRKYISNPKFVPKEVEKVSKAAKSLCMWVTAMDLYAKVNSQVLPKKQRLAEAEAVLTEQEANLKEKQDALSVVEARLESLQQEYDKSFKEKADLQRKIADTKVKLVRANKLVNGLASERKNWAKAKDDLTFAASTLIGDVLLASGYVAYLGPFTQAYRIELLKDWTTLCERNNVPSSTSRSTFNLESIIGQPIQTREWNGQGLPSDQLSIDNALIVSKSRRWPLIIDPQSQASRWIQNKERSHGLRIIKITEPNYLRSLENCLRIGVPVLIDNVGEELDPSLDPVLAKDIYKSQGRLLIRLGDQEVDYNPEFRLYICTKLTNPHFSPELSIKTTIVNFAVSPEGLEEQLLAAVVRNERPDLEQRKDDLVLQLASDRDLLEDIQNQILDLLAKSSGNILDDETLIETLDKSKETQENINSRVVAGEKTAQEINSTREHYRPIATRGQVLYFTIVDLALIDSMYIYSLQFFSGLFSRCLKMAPSSEFLQKRIENLIEFTTIQTFNAVSRGLFEKHKTLFSFLAASNIQRSAGILKNEQWSLLLSPIDPEELSKAREDPNRPNAISDQTWYIIRALADADPVLNSEKILKDIQESTDKWITWGTLDEPEKETSPLEDLSTVSGDGSFLDFNRILVLKAFRPERVVFSLPIYVSKTLGPEYSEIQPFSLSKAFNDSTSSTPIIFILSPGADPLSFLFALAETRGMNEKLFTVSLGQGQGEKAERLIEKAREQGHWVCLQNCHLAVSWMTALETIVESLTRVEPHENFRLFLTSMPSKDFPSSVLAAGIKLTNEPPRGIRANLQLSYQQISEELHSGEGLPVERVGALKRMLFGLAFFHAVLQERRKFGPVGFNIPYDFGITDIQVSIRLLRQYLDSSGDIPFQALRYLTGVISYGGRVTDKWDQRVVSSILEEFYSTNILDDGYSVDKDFVYCPPSASETLDNVLEYIKGLPTNDNPNVFGLHSNANISFFQKETAETINTILEIQPRISSSDEESPDEVVKRKVREIEQILPKDLKPHDSPHPDTFKPLPNGTFAPLSTVLTQECDRYNALLAVLRSSLDELQKAIDGLVVMSGRLEKMYDAFLLERVPDMWSGAAYPSLKPLASWSRDLVKRVEFMQRWIKQGPPPTFWMSAFFFPHGFLTGVLQEHARRTNLPIDTLVFRTTIMREKDTESPPEAGLYITGIFIEGARWNADRLLLDEPRPGVLFEELPPIWLEPRAHSGDAYHPPGTYEIPMYTTMARHGVLSTTGASTNFVTCLFLPIEGDESHWIRRGAAVFIQNAL
eukprot:gnl/Chilomastix_cuspidata/3994.p1 GENE.gnl/Chilomastix_cuspidata/3994~~gnl/Chilomastix_cuspidata/3994.p1  ORF type:complete len:4491 (+),score=293.00 gnl/Chilomastix_cuspidata/3994:101-13474(+)